MSKMTTPYRYDFVGSFLRPAQLKQARLDFETGKITKDELTGIEDMAITELVKKQKEAGYHVITDGEFRRATWHLDFMWGFEGVEHERLSGNDSFDGEVALIDDVHISGKISVQKHPFVEHFKFLKQFEDEETVAKQTMPAPGQFYAQFTGTQELARTLSIYSSKEEFIDDVVAGYIQVLKDLYEEGCRNVQFDDCTWGALVNPKLAAGLSGVKIDELPQFMELLISINNRVIEGKPNGMIVNTHICRGNYHSTFFSSGAYSEVAEYVFAKENVDAFFLEYDDERSGGFEPLKYVSGDKKVVLGLITTKRPELENRETVIRRIHEAEKYIPLERLYLSPQCGFASCEIGNKLNEEEQWAKLKLVKEIAQEVWG